jgi:hypothetical protein
MINNIFPLIVQSPVQSNVTTVPFNESMVVPAFESAALWIDDGYSLVLLGG